MRKIIMLLPFIAFSPLATSATLGSCPGVGDMVKPVKFDSIMGKLSNIKAEKGEFETTEKYKERLLEQSGKLDLNDLPILIEKYSKSIRYDADNERFVMDRYFFYNPTYAFIGVHLDESKKFPKRYGMKDYPAVTAGSTDKIIKKYTASNAMGAKFNVTEVQANRDFLVEFNSADDLNSSLVKKFDGEEDGKEVLYYDAKIEAAKLLSNKIKPGVIVDVVDPFIIKGIYNISPTVSNPRQTNVKTNIVMVNFKCLFLLNEKNIVIKNIN
jgi:hypothetical protein